MAHGEVAIACHLTITNESWDDAGMRQCAGAAIYRANVAKAPRSPDVIVLQPDRDKVFCRSTEFIAHHTRQGDAVPDVKDIKATHIECFDCDEVTKLDDPVPAAEAEDEYCPNDEGHAVSGLHVTTTALGLDNDRDYFHHGRKRYEYALNDLS